MLDAYECLKLRTYQGGMIGPKNIHKYSNIACCPCNLRPFGNVQDVVDIYIHNMGSKIKLQIAQPKKHHSTLILWSIYGSFHVILVSSVTFDFKEIQEKYINLGFKQLSPNQISYHN